MSHNRLAVDTLRGLACLLLVAYHVIGLDEQSGLRIVEGIYRDVNDILGYFRMPLFTFLSGFVYACRPFRENFFLFISKKVRRLLLPMLVVGTLFAAMQAVVSGSNSSVENWYLLHIIPVGHFWFIEALFLVFVLVALLEKFNIFASPKGFILALGASAVFYLLPIYVKYFSFSGFIYLLPYFLLGMGIHRYSFFAEVSSAKIYWLSAAVVIVFYCLYANILTAYGNRTVFGLVLGIVSCVSIFLLGLQSKALAWIGHFSYSIYLFHVFFTAASRIFFESIGIVSVDLIFFWSLLAGILGPVVSELILSRNEYTRVIFLGKSAKK